MTQASRAGSSPHTRGALDVEGLAALFNGIIPAYAGSTASTSSGAASRKDHPRIRGEHRGMCPTSLSRRGSSPHTRGARDRFVDVGFEFGIIPAYAGSTIRTLVRAL